jgi:hypothetical protein
MLRTRINILINHQFYLVFLQHEEIGLLTT